MFIKHYTRMSQQVSEHVIVHNDGRVEIQSTNPHVREFYHKNQLDYIPTAEDRAHAIFDQKVNGETETKIRQMYRVKKGGSFATKEYIHWREVINGFDVYGNKIQKRRIVGKWDNPQGSFVYDEKTRRKVCTGISSYETVYDVPFDTKLLDKMVEEGKIDEYTSFALDSVGTHYYVSDFHDFRNLSFEDLLNIGRTGLRPEQREEALRAKERKRTGQQD